MLRTRDIVVKRAACTTARGSSMQTSTEGGLWLGFGSATSRDINAKPERVWSMVSDIESWASIKRHIESVRRVDAVDASTGEASSRPSPPVKPGKREITPSILGAKYRLQFIGEAGVKSSMLVTVTSIDAGDTAAFPKSMTVVNDERGFLNVKTMTVEPIVCTDNCLSGAMGEEILKEGCRLTETAIMQPHNVFWRLYYGLGFCIFQRYYQRQMRLVLEDSMEDFARAAENEGDNYHKHVWKRKRRRLNMNIAYLAAPKQFQCLFSAD